MDPELVEPYPELCEYCGERPGLRNSSYWLFEPDDEEGGWVCEECERDFEADAEDSRRDRAAHYSDPKGD